MYLNGRPTTEGTIIACPSKCVQSTLIPEGMVKNLPKNFAVLEIIQESRQRERSHSSGSPLLQAGYSVYQSHYASNNSLLTSASCSNSSSPADEYKCDVCEMRGATIVCPSCAVCLCMSCSQDIHSRKGYHLHQLVPVGEFISSSTESLISTCTGSFLQGGGGGGASGGGDTESDLLFLSERTCKHHPGELTEYACETCLEDICKVCLLGGEEGGGEHRDHEARLLVDVASDKKEALKRAVDEIDNCHCTWNRGFDKCHELQEHLHHRSSKVEADIKTHFHAIHSLLHAKEEALLSQVRTEVETRTNSLQKQAE